MISSPKRMLDSAIGLGGLYGFTVSYSGLTDSYIRRGGNRPYAELRMHDLREATPGQAERMVRDFLADSLCGEFAPEATGTGAKTPQEVWDARFMRIAVGEVATWPKDFQNGGVGVLLVSPDRRRLSVGYSGGPRDYPCELRPEQRDTLTLHAEANAIANAGCDLAGWTMYASKGPCLQCALQIHQHRIARVVYREGEAPSRWDGTIQDALEFLHTVGVQLNGIPA